MTLGDVANGVPVRVSHVGGERAFRRRMMELGLLPGTRVTVVRVAPLGDPLELSVRGCRLSIRRDEARCVSVMALSPEKVQEKTSSAGAMPLPPGVPAAP
jgi:Fe2+ transport system protein FeoA